MIFKRPIFWIALGSSLVALWVFSNGFKAPKLSSSSSPEKGDDSTSEPPKYSKPWENPKNAHRKFVEVTGEGAPQDGRSIRGALLPEALHGNIFPIVVTTHPNADIGPGVLQGLATVTIHDSGDGKNVYYHGRRHGELKNWHLPYDEIRDNTVEQLFGEKLN